MADGFDVEIEQDGSAVRVALVGELDMATAPALADAVGPLIEQRVDSLELDLARLDFIDSSGLGVLLRLRVRANAAGVEWRMRHVSGANLRLFTMTGTADDLNVET